MPPRGREEIVNANVIINVGNETWRLQTLIPLIPEDDPMSCMQWLATRGLLKNSVLCNACNMQCTLSVTCNVH